MPVIFVHRTRVSTEYTLLTHIGVWVKNKIEIDLNHFLRTPENLVQIGSFLVATESQLKNYCQTQQFNAKNAECIWYNP